MAAGFYRFPVPGRIGGERSTDAHIQTGSGRSAELAALPETLHPQAYAHFTELLCIFDPASRL